MITATEWANLVSMLPFGVFGFACTPDSCPCALCRPVWSAAASSSQERPQDQPQQTVRRPKAPMRTGQDGDLVVESKHRAAGLGAPTARVGRSQLRGNATHRAYHGQLSYERQWFCPDV